MAATVDVSSEAKKEEARVDRKVAPKTRVPTQEEVKEDVDLYGGTWIHEGGSPVQQKGAK